MEWTATLPIPLLPLVLKKIRTNRAQVILLAPDWARRVWYPELLGFDQAAPSGGSSVPAAGEGSAPEPRRKLYTPAVGTSLWHGAQSRRLIHFLLRYLRRCLWPCKVLPWVQLKDICRPFQLFCRCQISHLCSSHPLRCNTFS